jgi:hypothetical protein
MALALLPDKSALRAPDPGWKSKESSKDEWIKDGTNPHSQIFSDIPNPGDIPLINHDYVLNPFFFHSLLL